MDYTEDIESLRKKSDIPDLDCAKAKRLERHSGHVWKVQPSDDYPDQIWVWCSGGGSK